MSGAFNRLMDDVTSYLVSFRGSAWKRDAHPLDWKYSYFLDGDGVFKLVNKESILIPDINTVVSGLNKVSQALIGKSGTDGYIVGFSFDPIHGAFLDTLAGSYDIPVGNLPKTRTLLSNLMESRFHYHGDTVVADDDNANFDTMHAAWFYTKAGWCTNNPIEGTGNKDYLVIDRGDYHSIDKYVLHLVRWYWNGNLSAGILRDAKLHLRIYVPDDHWKHDRIYSDPPDIIGYLEDYMGNVMNGPPPGEYVYRFNKFGNKIPADRVIFQVIPIMISDEEV